MTVRRFIVSTLLSSSSRRSTCCLLRSPIHRCCSLLSGGYHHPLRRGNTFLTPTKNQPGCFFATQKSAINVKTEYSEESSNMETREEMETGYVTIISQENIKPHLPTPDNLRFYKLSSLDQVHTDTYVPFVFFYPNDKESDGGAEQIILERSKLLKRSLSETLTRFYPFAGKIIDDVHIYCNDEGAYYVETRVDDKLSAFLSRPDYKAVDELLPPVPNSQEPTLGSFVVMVQVNFFNCGGIAISLCNSHKFVDGTTYMMFLNAWAATSFGPSKENISPSFAIPSLFPRNPKLPTYSSYPISNLALWPTILKHGKCSTRRFMFNASALSALKSKTGSSRVVSVLSLIWKCATLASRERSGSVRPSVMRTAVNLRPRCSPALPENSIGNMMWLAVARSGPDPELELNSMVKNLSVEIAKIDGHFIDEFKGQQGALKVVEKLTKLGLNFANYDVDYYSSTSLCNSGIYGADFGWGKPVRTFFGNLSYDVTIFCNSIVLMDTSSGSGIEAWVTLSQEDMAICERNPELLTFATFD